jgi:glycosyltransferase involved in cell wall biosynthesis
MLEVSVRQSDVIHTHGLWDPTLPPAAMLARKLQKPMVMTIHGMLDPLSFAHSAWKKRLALLAVIRSSLNTAGCYHATSPLEESHLRQFGLRGPVAVIPNGLDIAIFLKHDHQTSRQWLTWNLPILRDQRILLFLSRIHPQKGTAMLIDAWAGLGRDFPDWRLVIAGPDCLGHRAELEARAKDKGCAQRVVFMGPVSADDKAMLYAAADLFVLPSISECFGIVIAESLASGVPVIATTGAPWQELQEHRCGWWVDAALAPLTEALREGMSLPQQAREEAGLRGRELVASKYCWPAIGGQMVSMYNWLRSGGTPPEYVHLE